MEGGGVNVGVEFESYWFLSVLKGMLDGNCIGVFKV
jgi:hypothetical protein